MKLVNKYSYSLLERVEANGYRKYKTEYGLLPSVTTILSNTEPPEKAEALVKWRERVGEQEAATILNNSLSIGTALHKNMEDYITQGVAPGNGSVQTKIMSNAIIKNALDPYLDEAWGCEVSLYYPGLYAGSADLVGVYKGKQSIIDFKNSRKIKKKEHITSYFLQCAAYQQAHNEVHGTNIDQFVILMASQDLNFCEFIISGDEVKSYETEWALRLAKFYE